VRSSGGGTGRAGTSALGPFPSTGARRTTRVLLRRRGRGRGEGRGAPHRQRGHPSNTETRSICAGDAVKSEEDEIGVADKSVVIRVSAKITL
jgi:hypothetical protein